MPSITTATFLTTLYFQNTYLLLIFFTIFSYINSEDFGCLSTTYNTYHISGNYHYLKTCPVPKSVSKNMPLTYNHSVWIQETSSHTSDEVYIIYYANHLMDSLFVTDVFGLYLCDNYNTYITEIQKNIQHTSSTNMANSTSTAHSANNSNEYECISPLDIEQGCQMSPTIYCIPGVRNTDIEVIKDTGFSAALHSYINVITDMTHFYNCKYWWMYNSDVTNVESINIEFDLNECCPLLSEINANDEQCRNISGVNINTTVFLRNKLRSTVTATTRQADGEHQSSNSILMGVHESKVWIIVSMFVSGCTCIIIVCIIFWRVQKCMVDDSIDIMDIGEYSDGGGFFKRSVNKKLVSDLDGDGLFTEEPDDISYIDISNSSSTQSELIEVGGDSDDDSEEDEDVDDYGDQIQLGVRNQN